jgi:hypothetical protein
MNQNELDRLLKSARPPERTEEYWREFPNRITSQLHRQTQASAALRGGRKLRPLLAWGLGLATVCIAVGFIMKPQPQLKSHAVLPVKKNQLAEARKCYSELEALFPNQLQSIVFGRQGPRMVLADKANVPVSTPLYLRICGLGGCEAFITFSGQQIQVNGEDCEVLADAEGRVILVGNDRVWSETDPSAAIQIEAMPLEASL